MLLGTAESRKTDGRVESWLKEYVTSERLPGSFGPKMTVRYLLGCDFFERRGEKRIRWNTFDVPIFFFSDGVLCYWSILCVILLSVEVKNHLQVRVCA